jgi:hypothetical protein
MELPGELRRLSVSHVGTANEIRYSVPTGLTHAEWLQVKCFAARVSLR